MRAVTHRHRGEGGERYDPVFLLNRALNVMSIQQRVLIELVNVMLDIVTTRIPVSPSSIQFVQLGLKRSLSTDAPLSGA